MLELSERVQSAIDALFGQIDVERAKDLVREKCGSNILGCENDSPLEMERIRLAAVKCSAGDYSKLEEAVSLANTDWRDLLMEAGFGHDTEAHQKWAP